MCSNRINIKHIVFSHYFHHHVVGSSNSSSSSWISCRSIKSAVKEFNHCSWIRLKLSVHQTHCFSFESNKPSSICSSGAKTVINPNLLFPKLKTSYRVSNCRNITLFQTVKTE